MGSGAREITQGGILLSNAQKKIGLQFIQRYTLLESVQMKGSSIIARLSWHDLRQLCLSPGTPVYPSPLPKKTYPHDKTEILLKVVLHHPLSNPYEKPQFSIVPRTNIRARVVQ